MARPPKTNAEYFPHVNDVRNGDEVKALRQVFKHEGYAIYLMYKEKICKSPHFKLENSGLHPAFHAADFDLPIDRLTEITEYLLKLELIQKEGDYIVCNQLEADLRSVLVRRNGVSVDNNPQSKVKESIVNKIPSVTEFLEYAKTLDFFKGKNFAAWEFSLKSKYETYVDKGWKDGNDKPIINWKNTIKNIVTFLQPDKSLLNVTNSNPAHKAIDTGA